MKKIDFHIHTVPTAWDALFAFDIGILERYVSDAALEAIAITNHNVFDRKQFAEIVATLDIAVFPGIEVSLDCGHLLIISSIANLDSFEEQTNQISAMISEVPDSISVDDLTTIVGNLNEHLVIPHYLKSPAVKGEALRKLAEYVFCGEVDSAKKFIRAIKDNTMLTPVLFSDARICQELTEFSTRQTFLNCGELNIGAIKACLQDKGKVALSGSDGNQLFQVFNDGQKLSTGLNILLGERSSGKTFTLDRIKALHDHVKYIEQFSLVQQDDAAYEREFNRNLQSKRSQFIDNYLSGFRSVLNDVIGVDLRVNNRTVENYLESLLTAGQEADRRDAFSNTALYDESAFSISDEIVLSDLIESVRQVIENVEYRVVIEKYVDLKSMKRLAYELIEILWMKKLEGRKKRLVNGWVRDIKESLQRRTSAVRVQDVDLYQVVLEKKKIQRFSEIVKCLKKNTTIAEEHIQGFRVIATKGPFAGAGEVKDTSGVKTAFRNAYMHYEYPYEYLQALLDNDALRRSELYKLFVKISYKILNQDGFEVSGGERSEFRLLQELKDSQNYDILLVDEPESSFDNLFLQSDVNQIIKEISETMPVVVVTHNNTVGASAGADYLMYASKEIEEGNVAYRLYSGYPTDTSLHSPDGKTISNFQITLNSLEAGNDVYERRRLGYETIKDRK